MMGGVGGRDMPHHRHRNWGTCILLGPWGKGLYFPADSSSHLCCPELHRDSLSTAFRDPMTAGGSGKPRMMHVLEPEEFGKVCLGGFQVLCGEDSHAAWLEAFPGLLFPICSPHPHPRLQSILETPYFFMIYDLLHNTNYSWGSPNTSHFPLALNAQPLYLFFLFCLFRTAPMVYVAYESS